jgi:hypothetical protein
MHIVEDKFIKHWAGIVTCGNCGSKIFTNENELHYQECCDDGCDHALAITCPLCAESIYATVPRYVLLRNVPPKKSFWSFLRRENK